MQKHNPINPIIKKVILAVVIVLFIAAATAFTLNYIKPNITTDKTNANTTTSDITADSIITSYKKSSVMSIFTTSDYTTQSTTTILKYKIDNKSYGVGAKASSALVFSAINKSKGSDTQNIQKATNSFMTDTGLKITTNSLLTSTATSSYITYVGNKAVCQLSDTTPSGAKAGQYHTVACINISDIDQEYTAIEKLLTIYGQSQKLGDIALATNYTKTSGNKSYSILTLTESDATNKLLFAAVDDNWEYLGDLTSDNSGSGGKYTVSATLKTKIINAKYGNFISNDLLNTKSV